MDGCKTGMRSPRAAGKVRQSVMSRLLALCFSILCLLSLPACADEFFVSGRVVDEQGKPVAGASVQFFRAEHGDKCLARTGGDGQFRIRVNSAGDYTLWVNASSLQSLSKTVELMPGGTTLEVQLAPLVTRKDTVVITADVNEIDVLSPDPAEKVFVRQDLLDANPGRPGAPVSIPGYPIETASSGIKAPQYFAPGVAGDHGEPIAQYVSAGTYLVPNNLSANAHGNGYSDPNIFIPQILERIRPETKRRQRVERAHHQIRIIRCIGGVNR